MSPSSLTFLFRRDKDEFLEDAREDLWLDLSEILLILVDHNVVEPFDFSSFSRDLILSFTILRVSLFS